MVWMDASVQLTKGTSWHRKRNTRELRRTVLFRGFDAIYLPILFLHHLDPVR